MIDVTKLLVGESWGGDVIRYGHAVNDKTCRAESPTT